jgi:hypothetical protein
MNEHPNLCVEKLLMNRSIVRAGTLLAMLMTAVACNSGDGLGPDLNSGQNLEATVFLALEAQPTVFMEALFQGTISRDANGCLRAEGSEGATVIWPHGTRLEARGGALAVVDASGRVLGRIGGQFRMAGGYSQAAYHYLSDADTERAQTRCPGNYWVAGSIE